MAVTKGRANQPVASQALQALTAAALVLPGMILPGAQAADEEFSFQYGRYEEGGGNNSKFRSKANDLQVDSLQASWSTRLGDRFKLRLGYTQDTWSGATPFTTAPAALLRFQPVGSVGGASPYWRVDDNLSGYDPDKAINQSNTSFLPDGTPGNDTGAEPVDVPTFETVQVMATASPETRRQGDVQLSYEWDEAALDLGGGVSHEKDYTSRYVNLGGRLDFNQKRTTLSLGLGYANSTIDSQRFDFRATDGPLRSADGTINEVVVKPRREEAEVHEKRRDKSARLGLSQVLGKNTVVRAGVNYKQSTGYLSNPYKESVFITRVDRNDYPVGGLVNSFVTSRYEIRPDIRKQLTWSAGLVQYVPGLDAALHFDYSFYHDDWGINAHTFELSWDQPLGAGWTVTPSLRYYSQTAADFYSPYFILDYAVTRRDFLGSFVGISSFGGDPNNRNEDFLPLPQHFSSDHRLAAYGALSGGITVTKEFAKGVTFQAGFEYYTRKSSLQLGGDGDSDFADYHYYLASAAMRVDLAAFSRLNAGEEHAGHLYHGHPVPAGVMQAHMLKEGQFMAGYRYKHASRSGSYQHGTEVVDDAAIVKGGCPGTPGCTHKVDEMYMNMHMLNLMYAPTDWLSLMLMPTFVDKNMQITQPRSPADLLPGGHLPPNEKFRTTGGVGDTMFGGLVRIFDIPHHHLHLGLIFSAPTGDVDLKLGGVDNNDREEILLHMHYGMQLGSGTWDFKPSLTYTGEWEDWSWGAQLSMTKRLQSTNKFNYRLGNVYQATAWGSYNLFNWLSVSTRGVYTAQKKIQGEFNVPSSHQVTVDSPENYGGSYWDVGFGVHAFMPSGRLAGNTLSLEWVQPVKQSLNGYQVKREGELHASWSLAF